MFITEINTQYIRFQRFDLSNLLLKMYDHYINDKKHEPEFHMFLDIISSMYESYSDYVYSLSTYEFNLLKQISCKNAYLATFFAITIDEQIPELEPLIATSARNACDYAEYVLKGRFELGEEIIAKNAAYSYYYARYVLKERFELGEAIIATDAYCACNYAIHVLNGRFELGELTIQHNPEFCAKYIEFLQTKYPIDKQNKASSVLENIITSDRLL